MRETKLSGGKVLLIRILSVLFFALIITILVYVGLQKRDYLMNDPKLDAVRITDGWTVQFSEQETGKIVLPMAAELETDEEVVRLSVVLDGSWVEDHHDYLLVSVDNQELNIYLDDELIHTYRVPEDCLSKSTGTFWQFVQIPDGWEGKTLTLEYTANLGKNVVCNIDAPYFGTESDIIYTICWKEVLDILSDLFIAMMGIGFFIAGIVVFFRKNNALPFFVLGLFSLTCAMYFLLQSTIVLLAFNNSYLCYVMEYICLIMILIELDLILIMYLENQAKRYAAILNVVLVCYLLLNLILNFGFAIDFRVLLPYTQAMVVTSAILAMIFCIFYKGESEGRKIFLYSLFPFFVTALMDIISYRVNYGHIYFVKLGFLLFLIIQAIHNTKVFMRMQRETIQAETYRTMAYQDALTGLLNRAAYIRDIEELRDEMRVQDTSCPVPGCISVDANSLKETNDSFGHAAGDQLIIAVASILQDAVGDKGKVYRTGGDEFIVLFSSIAQADMEDVLKRIESTREDWNLGREFKISFSIGTAIYQRGDFTPERMVFRADRAMYQDKERYHKEKQS